jgi:hypothetical protein
MIIYFLDKKLGEVKLDRGKIVVDGDESLKELLKEISQNGLSNTPEQFMENLPWMLGSRFECQE